MTSNGTETLNQVIYKTGDGMLFNEYTNAFVHQVEENQKTTAVDSVTIISESFHEYYY